MNTTIEKSLDYRCFLLGIILYWMFDAVWVSFAPFFFALEAVLHPIAVVVGKSLLFLLVFYLLFRKPRMIDVKWGASREVGRLHSPDDGAGLFSARPLL